MSDIKKDLKACANFVSYHNPEEVTIHEIGETFAGSTIFDLAIARIEKLELSIGVAANHAEFAAGKSFLLGHLPENEATQVKCKHLAAIAKKLRKILETNNDTRTSKDE